MSAKKIAACAATVALLVAGQFVLSYISGVELVTVLLLCFCYVFGAACGMLTATAFSLVRCLIFGFIPHVVVLYLVYYNVFALLFGILGKRKLPDWICPAILILLAAGSAFFAAKGLPVSILYQTKIRIMLWTMFGITLSLLIVYLVLLAAKKNRELASVTTLAAFLTVIFTLLDDAITPLMLGYNFNAAVAYFYNGFLAMLPQTVCATISTSLLFYPLKNLFQKLQ